jgi:hypothetical protein
MHFSGPHANQRLAERTRAHSSVGSDAVEMPD